MTQPPAITSFDFETEPVNQMALIAAWLPEIEAVMRSREHDDRSTAFIIAIMRLRSSSKTADKIKLGAVIKLAGYSRSTFFRLFGNYNGFLLDAYQLICLLAIEVYAKHLKEQQLNVADFSKFTVDVTYGALCSVPPEIVQVLWRENALSHRKFHPHVKELTAIIFSYLTQNAQTKHLKIDLDELDGVLRALDLDCLYARLEVDDLWETPFYYKKIRHMLEGYLLSCA